MVKLNPTSPLVQLRRLSIRNFRNIESLDLDFEGIDGNVAPIMVFTGPNGCGKTAVLEACLLVAGFADLARGSCDESAIRNGAESYKISGSFEQMEKREVPIERSVTRGRFSSGGMGAQSGLHIEYFPAWRKPSLVGAVEITAGKRGKRPSRNEDNRLWIIKQFLVNSKAHILMSSGAKSDEQEQYKVLMEEINKSWKRFYPTRDGQFVVEPATDDPDDGFDVFLRNQQSRIPVDQLSAGQIELFCFLGAKIEQSSEPSIVLIDEPELHLDHSWHRLILRELRAMRPRSQFIIATHSPEIFESVASHERRLLLPEDDPRSKMYPSAKGQGLSS